jgi:hypothetical protein
LYNAGNGKLFLISKKAFIFDEKGERVY